MRAISLLSAVFLIGEISPSPMAQQALQDEGFEPTSTPLGPFGSTALDTWLAECATLVTGIQTGVSPAAGTGMIQICPTGGTYSQVRQRIAVPPTSGDHAQVACKFNASAGGNIGSITVFALNGTTQTALGGNSLSVDGNTATWESLSAKVVLPVGTTHVEVQVSYRNPELVAAGGFGFCDAAYLILAPQPSSYQGSTPGAIVNPDQLSAWPIVIGTEWEATVTPQAGRTGTPGLNLGVVLVQTGGAPGVSIIIDLAPHVIGFGSAPTSQLLVSGATLGTTVANWGNGTPGTIAIPCNSSFVGMPWYAQAIVLGDIPGHGVNALEPMFSNAITGIIY